MKKIKFIIIIVIILLISFLISDKNINQNAIVYIYDNNNEEIIKLINNKKTNTIDEIPPKLKDIFINIEDKTFYEHSGFDIYGICNGFITNIKDGSSIGTSTITQQYIKNTYLSNDKK